MTHPLKEMQQLTTEEDGGESGSWDAANMITAVTREEGSGTRGAFTELFGVVDEEDNDMITLDAQTTNSTSVMMTTVSENEYAIGYISLGSLDESLVKAVRSTELMLRLRTSRMELTKYPDRSM